MNIRSSSRARSLVGLCVLVLFAGASCSPPSKVAPPTEVIPSGPDAYDGQIATSTDDFEVDWSQVHVEFPWSAR